MTNTQDIVARLWNLCHVLRDDGITYHEYVTELTFLLFLKMTKETGTEEQLPAGYRWDDLQRQEGVDQLAFYRSLLVHLGNEGSGRVQAIFHDANTALRQPRNLTRLVESIDALDWYSAREEGLGDLYEGLLEKNASEKKSGAGQYFTPRPLIECMVNCIQPQPGEIVQDPAAGTGGFLIMADRYIKQRTDELFDLSAQAQEFQRKQAFIGVELVPDAHRLLLMNAMLHGIESDLLLGDTLAYTGTRLPRADVILTNPPFGTKRGGGRPTRDDFTYVTGNKQLAFLQHVYRGLKPGGRAAVVMPDNVLFEEGIGTKIRADLMDKCTLHTILRLPTGIFYAQGVKTNVLFFTRGATETGNTRKVWIYDLRTNMPAFGKRTPLTHEHFAEFEACYGNKSDGTSDLLHRIRAERRRGWEQAELARYEAKGQRPPKNWQDKYEEPEPADDSDLPELPANWSWSTLGTISVIQSGITLGQKKRNGVPYVSVPYLRVANVQRGYLDLSEVKTIEVTLDCLEQLRLQNGDLLFNEGGDRDKLGRGWVWKAEIEDCIHQNHVFRARLFCKELIPELISYYGNEFGRDFFFQRASQTVNLASINKTQLSRLPVPVIPLKEQEVLVVLLNEVLQSADELQNQGDVAVSGLDQLDQSILAKAFRGELVLQDPNDEPASALLARLREQRAQRAEAARHNKKTSTTQRGNKTRKKSLSLTQQLTLAEVLTTKD